MPSALHAEGQSIRVQRITVADGLHDDMVSAIAQDGDGYMWISTRRGGLQRYDGYNFKDYQFEVEDPDWTFAHSSIGVLYADRSGTLWLGSESGLKRYDPGTDSFTSYKPDPNKPDTLSGYWVTSINEDRTGMLWVGTMYNGLNRFDRESETFEHYRLDSGNACCSNNNRVKVVFEDRDGALWFGTDGGGASKLDPITKSFVHYRFDPSDPQNTIYDYIGGIFEDRTGTLWFTGDGLSRLKPDGNSFVRYRHDPDDPNSIGDNHVSSIVEDRFGILWIATANGLDSYDRKTDTFTHFRHDESDKYSLSDNFITPMYEDRAGVIWLGGRNGLNRFDPRSKQFANYSHLSEYRSSLSGFTGSVAYVDDSGILWVVGDKVLNKLDRQQNTVTQYPLLLDAKGGLSALDVTKEPGGAVWIGTMRAGLQRFDPSTETVTQYLCDPDNPQGLGPGWVHAVHIDRHGTLWVGMDSGLYEFVAEDQTFVRYLLEPSNPLNKGRQNIISEIYEDRSGTLWLGTAGGGFNSFDPANKTGTNFSLIQGKRRSNMDDVVTSFHEDRGGQLWLGTGSGLKRFDPDSETLIEFQNLDGVTDNMISGIQGDSSGYLWFYSHAIGGVVRFDPSSADYVLFEVTDGLPRQMGGRFVQNKSGEMVFGGPGGVVTFFPDRIELDSEIAPIVLTEFMLFNLPVPLRSPDVDSPLINVIGHSEEIVLSPEQYMFSFEFAALHYRGANRGKFAYQLVGHDPDWIVAGPDRRIATYSGVAPGNYQFRVKGTNGQGKWNEKGATVNVVILAPVWRTWWAYAVYTLVLIFAFFGLIQLRTRALALRATILEEAVVQRTNEIRENRQLIQHQADHLEELLHAKEKMFTNISHEFRTPLSLILGPINKLLQKSTNTKNTSRLQSIKNNAQRLLRLVNQLLDLSRLSSEEPLTKSAQKILPKVQVIAESFQALAREKNMTIVLNATDDLWVNCAPDALDKIVMNLLSNALKYSLPGGRVSVVVEPVDRNRVSLSISDTGVGIPADHQDLVFNRFHRVNGGNGNAPGTGIGLALVKDLVEANDGTVSLDSTPGVGTTVKVTLPRHHAAAQERDSTNDSAVSEALSMEVATLTSSMHAPSALTGNRLDNEATILIIEDNAEMQNYLVELLSVEYRCLVAADGLRGIDMALEHVPDLVLCDVMLPRLDGYQVNETLKSEFLTSHIPIILLTARGDHDSRLKGLHGHVDDYITKPFDDDELTVRIDNLLKIRDELKRRFSKQLFDETLTTNELSDKDQKFLDELKIVMKRHHSDADFRVEEMSLAVAMSHRQLQRKLKALIDHSPMEYLRAYRLARAMTQLRQGKNVGVVAESVGFSSQTYFASCFRDKFGVSPKQYQQSMR